MEGYYCLQLPSNWNEQQSSSTHLVYKKDFTKHCHLSTEYLQDKGMTSEHITDVRIASLVKPFFDDAPC